MAKSKSYFGLRRGSTKTQTFSVLNGMQITKDRVEGGRNPRTPEQMAQRMCMATASAAYALMKQIVDHSFEGVTYGGRTMSEFIRVNADALRQNYLAGGDAFAYNYYRDRSMRPGAYIMSRGKATPVTLQSVGSSVGVAVTTTVDKGGLVTMYFGAGASEQGHTADELNAALGLKVGDMATICIVYPITGVDAWGFTFVRLKSLLAGKDILTNDNIATYFAFESPHAVSTTVVASGLQLIVTVPDAEPDMDVAWCAIHSLKTSTGWSRSDTVLYCTPRMDISPTAEDALASYPVGPSYVLNGGSV